MLDQLRIGDKYSYDDFYASVCERHIGKPKKKSIKEKVPYSNTTYDFTAINGEIYWEERELEYILELDADTPEALEELKIELSSWLMNVMQENLYDPFIENYHFKATFEDIDFDDSEVEKTTVTVKFMAYPYMMSNNESSFSFEIPTDEDVTIIVTNKSSHRITPTFIVNVPVTISTSDSSYSISAGETTDDSFCLKEGENEIIIKANAEGGTLTIKFSEEVF